MQPRIACINLTGVPRPVQLLKINGFDTTDYDEDPSVASTTVSAGGYDWVVEYYPREWISGDSWVMLRITLAGNTNGQVAASFASRLVDQRYGRLGTRQLRPPVSAMLGKGQAVDLFVVSRPELFRSGYVHDDSFLLELEIIVGGEPKGATTAAGGSAAAPSSDLHRHLGELWRSQKGTDVTFLVSGEHIAAHRCVLAARSPVFTVELFGDMKETSSPIVEIEDMEPEVFRALMHFIYTDTSPELDDQGEEAKAMAQHLLAAADRYGMERLKLICEEKVCGDVSVDTAATHLALAEQHGCPRLKARCMEFMVACPASVEAVVKTDGYNYLMATCPSVVSELLVALAQRCN